MLALVRLPEVIARSTELRAPNHLAEYAYDIVTNFNRAKAAVGCIKTAKARAIRMILIVFLYPSN